MSAEELRLNMKHGGYASERKTGRSLEIMDISIRLSKSEFFQNSIDAKVRVVEILECYSSKIHNLEMALIEREKRAENAEAALVEVVKRERAMSQKYYTLACTLTAFGEQEPDAWLTRSSRGGAIYSTAHDQQQDAYDDAHAERIAGVDAVEVLPLYLDLRGKEGK